MGSIIRSTGTVFYTLLYSNSRRSFNGLKYMYSVISVIDNSLPGNTKNRESTRSWTDRVRLVHSWAVMWCDIHFDVSETSFMNDVMWHSFWRESRQNECHVWMSHMSRVDEMNSNHIWNIIHERVTSKWMSRMNVTYVTCRWCGLNSHMKHHECHIWTSHMNIT